MSAATPGLVVAATDPISSFLSCADLASEPAVPYRSIWCAGSSSHCRPPLRQLLRGKGRAMSSRRGCTSSGRCRRGGSTPRSSEMWRPRRRTTQSPSPPTRISSDSVCMLWL